MRCLRWLAKAIAGRLDDPRGDARVLNAALAESFFRFDLLDGSKVKPRLVGPPLLKASRGHALPRRGLPDVRAVAS
jgi:hypothetical protein